MGLAGRHVMCLNYLRTHPDGLTAGELCSLCGEDKAAISRTTADLKRRGLICRAEGYRSPIRLTAQGEAAADRVAQLSMEAVESGGAGLTEAQRTALYEAMDIISANLRAYCDRKEARA